MVAISGRGWVLAPCLERLIDETDRLFPKRDTSSDGSIGDLQHSARASDHNPDGGYVRAVDVTDDDAHGCDVSLLAAHLVATKDHRVKYLIHKGTIWKAYASNGLAAWTPQVYTGINAHLHHLHVSVLDGQENALGAWWPQSKPKPPAAPPIALPKGEPMLYVRKLDRKDRILSEGGDLIVVGVEADYDDRTPVLSVGEKLWKYLATRPGLVRL